MSQEIKFPPNTPVKVRLADPQGDYWNDDERAARYQTSNGEQFIKLNRQAYGQLFMCDPAPGEEIIITQVRPGEYTIALTPASELARAEAEMSQDKSETLPVNLEPPPARPPVLKVPTPIRAASKAPEAPPDPRQTRFWDQGTGTYGPAPRPAVRPRRPFVEPIPANVAVREILAFIVNDPGTKNWSSEALQDLASTIYIAHAKQGHIGPWERGE
jgi:hypothetical protein